MTIYYRDYRYGVAMPDVTAISADLDARWAWERAMSFVPTWGVLKVAARAGAQYVVVDHYRDISHVAAADEDAGR